MRPSRPANVAAACRAMKNMGLADAVARRAAARASTSPRRGRSPTAPGTSSTGRGGHRACSRRSRRASRSWARRGGRCPGPGRPGGWPRRPATLAGGGTLSLVFGPEASRPHGRRAGPVPRARARADGPAHPSLNLAQAVLLLAYELRLAALEDARRRPGGDGEPPGPGRRRGARGARAAGGAARDRLPRPREPGPHPHGAAATARARRPRRRGRCTCCGASPARWPGRAALRAGGAGSDNPPGAPR